MRVRNWNFFYKKEDISLKEKIVSTMSLWIAIGFLWWAFGAILGEHFPQFIEGVNWKILLPWMLGLWISYDWLERYLKKWNLLVRALILAMPVGYAVVNYEEIIGGMIAILEGYYPYVNAYYQTGFSIQGGITEYIPMAVTFVGMVYWLFCWMLAYGTGKKIGLALFPVLALSLELLVGLAPVGNGLLYWFLAIFVLLSLGGKVIWTKLLIPIAVSLALLCTKGIFGEQIEDFATREKKEAVLEWQDDVLKSDVWNVSFVDFLFGKEVLRNKAPNYTGKTVLEIKGKKIPYGALYLKGFYGTDYKDSVWSCDTSDFSVACQEAGKGEQEMAQMLFQLPLDQIFAYHEGFGDHPGILSLEAFIGLSEYEITTVGLWGDSAYVPYASDYESLDEVYSFKGDYLLKKSIWDDTIKVQTFEESLDQMTWKSLSLAIETGLYGERTQYADMEMLLSSHIPPSIAIDLGERKEELDWYNALAKEYLYTSEDLPFIEEAAKNLSQISVVSDGDIYLMEFDGIDFYDANSENTLPNNYRLLMASSVTDYLASQMSYSLILDELPKGADPIEYALTIGHEGYCMHFASAATLLLRELGVPARYASGYIVKPDAFKETEDGYFADVTDYASHAWVEIYLDYIGWIPVEVTPGYDSYNSQLPTQKDPELLENLSEKHRQELAEKESEVTETETETESKTSSEAEHTQSGTTESEEVTNTEEENTQDEVGIVGIGNGNGTSRIFIKLFFTVLGLYAVAEALVFFVQFQRKQKIALLEANIQKKRTRKAVILINKHILFLLRLQYLKKKKQLLFVKNLSDREYENTLIQVFPNVNEEDWKEYMRIIEKMYYSLEDISEEEMMHCYHCYHVLASKKNKNL